MPTGLSCEHHHRVRDSFDRAGADYDRLRRQLIPRFDDFYGTVLEQLADVLGDRPAHCVDLGAGTGLLTEMVLEGFPAVSVTAMDGAAKMIDQAKARLSRFGARARLVVCDYRSAPLPDGLDAVISALSIHHLAHDEKRALFRKVYQSLRPGGIFINADQSLGPAPSVEAAYQSRWIADVKAAGTSPADLGPALERLALDRSALMSDQLAWLAEAGFSDADVAWKRYRFTVFRAVKAAGTAKLPKFQREPYL